MAAGQPAAAAVSVPVRATPALMVKKEVVGRCGPPNPPERSNHRTGGALFFAPWYFSKADSGMPVPKCTDAAFSFITLANPLGQADAENWI